MLAINAMTSIRQTAINRAAQTANILLLCLLATGAYANEPTVTIGHDDKRDAMRVAAAMDIAAPPAVVWKVISDCNRAPKIVPNMESCHVIQRDPAGQWDVRETVMNVMLLPRIHSVSRNDFEPARRLAFKRTGGDMRVSEGEWRLEPLRNGKATRLHYNARFAPNFMVPQFLIDQAAARDFPTLFHAIERESLADAVRAEQ